MIPDALIAATALQETEPLATRNHRHFVFIEGNCSGGIAEPGIGTRNRKPMRHGECYNYIGRNGSVMRTVYL
jgi:hypothetical protein